jgi:virulence-associated protein VagC
MTTTQIFQTGDGQVVRLPAGYEFAATEIAIRREGEAVILEPIKSGQWPEDFFERIRIDDAAFRRPDQGAVPASPEIESP